MGADNPVGNLLKQNDSRRDEGGQSWLDYAVKSALVPALSHITTNEKVSEEVTDGVKSVAKMAPLFMESRAGMAGAIAAFALDEIKTTDRGSQIAIDAAAGIAKAGALLGTQRFLAAETASPALTGVGLGVVGRATDVGFTRSNYYDQDGKFNLNLGFGRAATAAVESIPTDYATFVASDIALGSMTRFTRGASTYNHVAMTALTAGTFNVTAAVGTEVSHQISDKKFDPAWLLEKTAVAGASGLMAGGLAGLERRSFLSTGIRDSAGALESARNSKFQLGETGDAAQMALAKGDFVIEKHEVRRNGEHIWGKVIDPQSPTDNARAIFRLDDGTESFAHRMQSEIGLRGLNSKLNFDKSFFPATAQRDVTVEGNTYRGFIQEVRGETVRPYFKANATELNKAGYPTKGDIQRQLSESPQLKEALTESWAERLIYGEWDNHSLNQVIVRTNDGIKAGNIDVGNGVLPAKTTSEYTPAPGARIGFDYMNFHIYNELAGQKFHPALSEKVQTFAEKFSTPAGRSELQDLGFTPQQVDGIVGRAQWFAENQMLPKTGFETSTFNTVKDATKWLAVKAGLRGPSDVGS
ncbi:MAG TPA: hypothetical protein V6C76_13000 [Drouetiella sp.]